MLPTWATPAVLKAAAAGTVLLLCIGGLYAWRGRAVDKAVNEVNVEAAVSANSAWQEIAERLKGELAQCTADRVAERETASMAVAQAEADKREAAERLRAFEHRWAVRSQSCGAALMDMERACQAEIGEY
jgi:hypothetical protein